MVRKLSLSSKFIQISCHKFMMTHPSNFCEEFPYRFIIFLKETERIKIAYYFCCSVIKRLFELSFKQLDFFSPQIFVRQ